MPPAPSATISYGPSRVPVDRSIPHPRRCRVFYRDLRFGASDGQSGSYSGPEVGLSPFGSGISSTNWGTARETLILLHFIFFCFAWGSLLVFDFTPLWGRGVLRKETTGRMDLFGRPRTRVGNR